MLICVFVCVCIGACNVSLVLKDGYLEEKMQVFLFRREGKDFGVDQKNEERKKVETCGLQINNIRVALRERMCWHRCVIGEGRG